MNIDDFLDFLISAHYTYLVDSPFAERGGIMLVAPPESLGTTIVRSLEQYGAQVVGDLTTKAFGQLKHRITAGKLHTIGIEDFAMLYKRKSETTAMLMGTLQSLVEEGVTKLHWETHEHLAVRARALVVAKMTERFYQVQSREWGNYLNDGFMRRFLWIKYRLANPEALREAVFRWERWVLSLEGAFRIPYGIRIPHATNRRQMEEMALLLRVQEINEAGGGVTPLRLLSKIHDVAQWIYTMRGSHKTAMDLIRNVGQGLGSDQLQIDLREEPKVEIARRRKA